MNIERLKKILDENKTFDEDTKKRILESEKIRNDMKRERRQKEGQIIHSIKNPKKTYKKCASTASTPALVNRAKDWYSK